MVPHVSPSPADAPTPLPVQPLGALPAPAPPAPSTVAPHVSLDAPATPLPAIGLGPARPAEPAPQAVAVRVLARLSNGERIEVGAHANESDAKAEAAALMRFLREAGGDWPFLNGRFVRPEAIVSLDVVAG